jgi:hypothetical protein
MRQSESSEALRFVDTDDMLFCVEMETDGAWNFWMSTFGLITEFRFPRPRKEEMAAATRRDVATSPLCVARTALAALERTRPSSASQ